MSWSRPQPAPGWWKAGNDFYFVKDDGRAFSTAAKPKKETQVLSVGNSTGYYFEAGGGDITFVWRKPAGKTQVERWTAPTETKPASIKIDGFTGTLARVF